MMRFFFRIMHLLLLVSVPSCLMSAPKMQLYGISQGDRQFSYDAILALIEKIESEEFEEICSPEDWERINQMLAHFAREGLLSSCQGEKEELEEDIEKLLDITPAYSFASLTGNDFEVVLCRSWLKKKCHQVGKFVRHHKKEILIGTAIVVAVVAVAIVTTAATASAAGAAVGAATASSDKLESKERQEAEVAPQMQETIEEHVSSFKELIVEENLLQEFKPLQKQERTFGDKARDLGSYVAHDIFDAVADLAIVVPDTLRATAHAKIDQIFSTKFAIRWSKEVKENSVMDNFAMGIIPIPGQLNGGIFSAGKPAVGCIPKTEANAIKGWVVGHKINNLTQFGTVPTWSTVRRRYWKNRAHWAKSNISNEYGNENIMRMEKGLAPQRKNELTGLMESKELHHNPPQKDGGLFDFIEMWPQEHANADSFRRLGGQDARLR